MRGTEEYASKYEQFAKRTIEKHDPDNKFFLKGFYNSLLASGKTVSTSYVYINRVALFVSAEVTDIAKIDVDSFTAYLISLRNKSSSVQIDAYHALQRYSKYLFVKKITDIDYMQYIDKPRRIETEETKEKRENGFLTTDEIKRFLDVIKELGKDNWEMARNYAIVMTFLSTGIRRSALCKLDVRDFDPITKTICVVDKGNIHKRLSLTDNANHAICTWLYYRERTENKDKDALFLSVNGTRIYTGTIYKLISKAGNYIPNKHITPHKLRATFGTELYNKTKDIYFVQQAMGHTSPQVTELYIRGNKANVSSKASDIMNDII